MKTRKKLCKKQKINIITSEIKNNKFAFTNVLLFFLF